MISTIKKALGFILIFTIITGILYPSAVTILAQGLFKEKVNGSLIEKTGEVVASKYIGQNFTSLKYFWGRPSETESYPYNAMGAKGSNKSPASEEYEKVIEKRVAYLQKYHGEDKEIPVDLVTASGSGIDPHISLAAAEYQVERVAKNSGISEKDIEKLILNIKEDKLLGFFGEPIVNVVELNLALDEMCK